MAYQRWYKTVRDQQGNAVNGASCAIHDAGTANLATVYDPSSSDLTPAGMSNPFITGPTGVFGFMAGDGEYDIQISGGSLATQQFRVTLNGAGIAVPDTTLRTDLADTTSDLKGDALIGVKQPFTGAVARTQHGKNQDILTTSDFPDLATAISDIGSAKTTLIVNSAVTVDADLTIPANVSVEVRGSGLITVNNGKRLYINGPFDAPRLQRCFYSSILVTTLTASVNGNALVVTAASSNVLSTGHAVLGNGIEPGQIIQATYGYTGVGTYSLSSYNGVISSETVTAYGPSVVFAAGAIKCAYPQWFGAVADETTDCRDAIYQAVLSMPWGGRVHFPSGSYLCGSGNIFGHPQLTISGDGATDNGTGAPPNAFTVPSYVFFTVDGNLFVFGGNCSHVKFRDISFGAQAAFGGANLNPVGSRNAIVFNGHAGQTVYGLRIENCWFYNLAFGILINDSWAGVGDGVGAAGTYWNGTASVTYYDWALNPGVVTNGHFIGCAYGIQFNSNNADAWTLRDCVFILAASTSGVYLKRCGFIKLDNCFAYSVSMVDSEFINIQGAGTSALDTITVDNCQAELCSHFINFQSASTNDVPPAIIVKNSIHQMGADVFLGKACEYISQGNEIQSAVYAVATGIKVHSVLDNFFFQNFISAPTWNIDTTGGDVGTVQTYIPGKHPASALAGPLIKGIVSAYGTVSPATGTWAVGERCVRTPPMVGSPKAWVCTVAGTPGTWVSEGNL